MRARSSFTVRADPPEGLEELWELARNLRWTWDEQTQSLFRDLDPAAWDAGPRDPLAQLGHVGAGRLRELAADRTFKRRVSELRRDLEKALTEDRWFQREGPSGVDSIAYFSPEFGIAEAIPQYSGGLGVLAGDHLRAASDLGVPLCGVGLLYRHGYFRQALDDGGWQQEQYPLLDPHGMALTPTDAVVEVELGSGRRAAARVWRCDVGRVRLYLLDADIPENDEERRQITDRLYGGGSEHRIRQELLLGVGGVRALDALGERPQVFHTNEGHAAFLTLERIRALVSEEGLSFEEAKEAVRAQTVFTTHTSVPAGIDRFDAVLARTSLGPLAEGCGVAVDELVALGQAPGDPLDAPFNMAVLAFRLSGSANGVSKLHGAVSRSLFSGLWPGLEDAEVPISSITNGVHARAWTSSAMADLLDAHVGEEWPSAGVEEWKAVEGIADANLWEVRGRGRADLVRFVRDRMKRIEQAKGAAGVDLAWCDRLLDPDALTIGFARRFAGYKRATLLLSDPERLQALLTSADRPVQLVFSGKAHPADEQGKEMIRQIVAFSRDPVIRDRIVFVPDYEIGLARALYRGADVWLNTPRRPHEACGTSGMKSVLNGGLHCSVLDGWWDECYDGTNGWAIASAERYPDAEERDAVEAGELFELLERDVVPAFYERDANGIPTAFLARIRRSLVTLGPDVVASRMVRDYTTQGYAPAAARYESLSSDAYAGAKSFAVWRARVEQGWSGVSARADALDEPAELGAERRVTAQLDLDVLDPDDVEVQLVHGPVDDADRIWSSSITTMQGVEGDGSRTYEGAFTCERAGRYGYAVRVVPSHEALGSWAELGLVKWAD